MSSRVANSSVLTKFQYSYMVICKDAGERAVGHINTFYFFRRIFNTDIDLLFDLTVSVRNNIIESPLMSPTSVLLI